MLSSAFRSRLSALARRDTRLEICRQCHCQKVPRSQLRDPLPLPLRHTRLRHVLFPEEDLALSRPRKHASKVSYIMWRVPLTSRRSARGIPSWLGRGYKPRRCHCCDEPSGSSYDRMSISVTDSCEAAAHSSEPCDASAPPIEASFPAITSLQTES